MSDLLVLEGEVLDGHVIRPRRKPKRETPISDELAAIIRDLSGPEPVRERLRALHFQVAMLEKLVVEDLKRRQRGKRQ